MEELPIEVKLHCFLLLGLEDYISLLRCRLVCKEWDLLCHDDQIWKAVHEKRFFWVDDCGSLSRFPQTVRELSHVAIIIVSASEVVFAELGDYRLKPLAICTHSSDLGDYQEVKGLWDLIVREVNDRWDEVGCDYVFLFSQDAHMVAKNGTPEHWPMQRVTGWRTVSNGDKNGIEEILEIYSKSRYAHSTTPYWLERQRMTKLFKRVAGGGKSSSSNSLCWKPKRIMMALSKRKVVKLFISSRLLDDIIEEEGAFEGEDTTKKKFSWKDLIQHHPDTGRPWDPTLSGLREWGYKVERLCRMKRIIWVESLCLFGQQFHETFGAIAVIRQ